MPKKKEAEFRNPTGNGKKLPSSFYGEVSGGGSSSKNKYGTSGGLGGTATVGYRPTDKLEFSATASGDLSFFLPSKELKKFGVSSSEEGDINLDKLKAKYNISKDTDISVSYNPKEKGFMFRLNSKF
jgi:hypothetical protein